MFTDASPLTFVAVGNYLAVVVASSAAAIAACRNRQISWHWRLWSLLALVFAFLSISRIFEFENLTQQFFREFLYSTDAYNDRRSYQRPVIAALVVVTSLLAGWSTYRWLRYLRGRRNWAVSVAISSGLGMIVLVLFRLISLSPVDYLLYGPLKLNWIADSGFSLTVVIAALFYIKTVRQRP